MARTIRKNRAERGGKAVRTLDAARDRGLDPIAWRPLPQTVPAPATHTWIPMLLLAAAVGIAFAQGWKYPFTSWDDGVNLAGNEYIRGFTRQNLEWMLTKELLGVWQPVSWIVAALQWELFGKVGNGQLQYSQGIHVVNIALHAAASVLCFVVMRRLIVLGRSGGKTPSTTALAVGATFAGLVFAIHPLRVESVSWATAQPYILAMIGCLGAVWCYLRANESEKSHVGWLAASVGCFTLSLLCKSIAVPLVAVLLILDVYPLRRLGGRAGWNPAMVWRVALEKIPFGLITLGAIYMAVWATSLEKKYPPEPGWEKLLVASYCMMFYVVITFVPIGIAPNYQKPLPFPDFPPVFCAALVALVVVTAAILLLRRRWPWLLAAWATYVIILLPVVGFVKHGGQMAADRYTYLSCIGWAVLLGAGLTRVWQRAEESAALRPTGMAAAGLAAAISVGLGVMTWRQVPVWKDSVAVWSAMIERNPRWWMGYYNVAKLYKQPEWFNPPRAMQLYEAAIALNPFYPEAHIDLGNMYKDKGDWATARRHYELSLKGKPRFHMAEYHLATILAAEGKYEEALERLRVADEDAHLYNQKHRYSMIAMEIERVKQLMAARDAATRPK